MRGVELVLQCMHVHVHVHVACGMCMCACTCVCELYRSVVFSRRCCLLWKSLRVERGVAGGEESYSCLARRILRRKK